MAGPELKGEREEQGDKGWDRGRGWGEGRYRPARPLLAGRGVFWERRGGVGTVSGGSRQGGGGKRGPGPWIGTLERGGRGESGGGKGITGWVMITGRGLEGAARLPNAGGAGTGGQNVAELPTVGAEASVRPTTALLVGKGAAETPGTIHIHGGGLGRSRGWLERRGAGGGRGKGPRRGGWRLIARKGCGSVVLLHGDGCRNVSLEGKGDGTPGCHFETNSFTQFLRKHINEGVISPPGNKCVCDILKCYCEV